MTEALSDKVLYWAIAAREPTDRPPVLAIRGRTDWRQVLETELAGTRCRSAVVVVEHPIVRAVIDLARGRSPGVRTPVPIRAVRQVIGEIGWDVDAVFKIWPVLDQPRVAVPEGDLRIASWAQRAGVLGGGKRALARVVLRSPVSLPVVMMSAGATALVIVNPDRAASP